jgi:glycosyltransferase involved in cell wall biosynthesis
VNKKQVMLITPCIPPYAGSGVYRNIRFIHNLDRLGWGVSVLSIRENCIRENLSRDSALLQKIPDTVHLERTHATRLLEAFLRFRNGPSETHNRQSKETQKYIKKIKNSQKQVSLPQDFKDFISTLLRFPDAEIGWVPWAILRGLKTCKKKKIEVLFTSGPPHSCHLVGWALQNLTGLPWVADFRDPWTRQGWIDEATKKTWHHRWKMYLEHRVISSANRVILNTNEMRDEFSTFYSGIPSGKFTAIYNGFNPEEAPELPKEPENEKVFTVTHTGSFYKKRTPFGFLRALSELIEEQKIALDQIHIRLIGRCDRESILEKINCLGLTSCVDLIPWVTHEESLRAITASDLLLLIQPETNLQIPGKLFEYIMLEKNILALADDGATSNVVRNYELGHVVKPMDIPAIKNALNQIYNNRFDHKPLPPGYLRALEIFNAHSLTKQLEKTFTEVIQEAQK